MLNFNPIFKCKQSRKQFLNLKMPEYSTFSRYMNFYFCSEVEAMWQEMKSLIHEVLKPLSIRVQNVIIVLHHVQATAWWTAVAQKGWPDHRIW